jgi:hypothetical protein
LKNHTLRAHLYRAFTTPALYISTGLYALLLLLDTLGNSAYGTAMNRLLMSQCSQFYMVLSTVLPASAYALTYVDAYDTRLLYPWVVRTGTNAYARSYYIASVLSGFLVSFFGCLIFISIRLLLGDPLEYSESSHIVFIVYRSVYNEKWMVGYMLLNVLRYALGAAAMSGIAAACSSLFHLRFFTLLVPVFYFFGFRAYCSVRKLLNFVLPKPFLLDPNSLIGHMDYAQDPLQNALWRLVAVGLHLVVFGILTTQAIKRSVENA